MIAAEKKGNPENIEISPGAIIRAYDKANEEFLEHIKELWFIDLESVFMYATDTDARDAWPEFFEFFTKWDFETFTQKDARFILLSALQYNPIKDEYEPNQHFIKWHPRHEEYIRTGKLPDMEGAKNVPGIKIEVLGAKTPTPPTW